MEKSKRVNLTTSIMRPDIEASAAPDAEDGGSGGDPDRFLPLVSVNNCY